MKIRIFILFLLGSLFTFSCREEQTIQQGKVQFSFKKIDSGNTGGRILSNDIPAGASLVITITKQNGDSVCTFKKIEGYGAYCNLYFHLPPGLSL